MIIMKRYFFLLLIFSLSGNAYADGTASLRLNADSADAHSAGGIAIINSIGMESVPLALSFGISVNRVKSDVALANKGRKSINPVYLFGKLSINHTITPFVEFGFDLGDMILEDISDSLSNDPDADSNDDSVDTYYSLGLTLTMGKKYAVSLYHKKYNINYYDINFPNLQEEDLEMNGISFSYYM